MVKVNSTVFLSLVQSCFRYNFGLYPAEAGWSPFSAPSIEKLNFPVFPLMVFGCEIWSSRELKAKNILDLTRENLTSCHLPTTQLAYCTCFCPGDCRTESCRIRSDPRQKRWRRRARRAEQHAWCGRYQNRYWLRTASNRDTWIPVFLKHRTKGYLCHHADI